MIRVLVVDDSQVAREMIVHVLGSAPGIQVIGTAGDGRKAIEAVQREKPDIVTMDVNMPEMSGLEATRSIMENTPVPIVIVSGSSVGREIEDSFDAMEAGALAVVRKPAGIGHPNHEEEARDLIRAVKLMSEVKVVRRWPRKKERDRRDVAPGKVVTITEVQGKIRVVAIGASTGGPPALHTILAGLPRDFAAPILIVQHMASGFVQGMAEWLSQSSGFPVHVAADGDRITPGNAYVAPDGYHMGVREDNSILLSRDAPRDGVRPCISFLFRSVAEVYGEDSIGVLLTGMGRDGAGELKLLRERGAMTIAQDEESSVIYGMPGHAVRLDAATFVLPPERMAAVLASLVNNRRGTAK